MCTAPDTCILNDSALTMRRLRRRGPYASFREGVAKFYKVGAKFKKNHDFEANFRDVRDFKRNTS